jgi:uncharacterized protein (TIGR02687 family)
MNLNQIETALIDIFQAPLKDEEERKIVFWTDVDEEFSDDIEKIRLDHVKVVRLYAYNQFRVKHLLEEEDTLSSYLIYTNQALDSKDNWLYDTVLYARTFYADRLSLMMDELNMDSSFRPIVQRYQSFFNNKDRFLRFKAFDIHTYTKESIELAMMNTICKTRILEFETVLRTVLMDTLDERENRYVQDFVRYFDLDVFWAYVAKEYGYERQEKSLKTLFIHLTVTALSQSMDAKHLQAFSGYIAEENKANGFVFIDHWMNHKTDDKIFNEYVEMVEREIPLTGTIEGLPVESFKHADIFPSMDRALIVYIANSLMEQREDYGAYLDIIVLRRTKHFYEQFRSTYEALFYTVKMYAFRKQYTYGIPQGAADDMYQAYVREFYVMDAYYRKFYIAFDVASGSDLLFQLRDLVENMYTNWFMGELSAHWSSAVQHGMTENWTLPGVTKQQKFYSTFIEPHMDKNERAFVIISDAMRYEVGVELAERINAEIIGSCKLDTMLGVIPSVTKLGMAALLPQHRLTIDEQANVLANGHRSSGTKNREKILQTYSKDSIAIDFNDILNQNKTSRRETFKGKKLIYIYHDTIDATGDDAATEIDTFQAVEQAIEQLSDLVRIIRNDLSGTNIYVTADHGFIYQRDALEVSDLMEKESVDALEIKRRYLLTHDKLEAGGQLAIHLSTILQNDPPLYAYVPNATIRYRIQGAGANFVHGGASLQEIVVPVLSIKNKRADQRGAQIIEKIQIYLTTSKRRITNNVFTLDFFQNEKIADKRIPRTVKVYMGDGENNVLSNEEIIIGDLIDTNPKERVFKVQFALKNRQYDRNRTYYLMMQDMETEVIIEKVPFTIQLGLINDFDV